MSVRAPAALPCGCARCGRAYAPPPLVRVLVDGEAPFVLQVPDYPHLTRARLVARAQASAGWRRGKTLVVYSLRGDGRALRPEEAPAGSVLEVRARFE